MKERIRVTLATTKEEKQVADKLVVEHHSYVASARTVGRVLKYLIYDEDELIGTFWVGSGFKPTPKAILDYFQVSQKEYDKIFNEVADNKRFAMSKHVKNAGTIAIKLIRKRVKQDWKDRYGDDLKAILTTIGSGKSGAVYKADNWIKIGETAGLPNDRKSMSMKWNDNEEIKERYVKPTGEDKKLIFITTKL